MAEQTTLRDPFSVEPLPRTHYFPSPARKLSALEKQLHLGTGERQFSPSRSEITPVTATQSLSSLEGQGSLSISSGDTSYWESWPASRPLSSTGGGAAGSLPPLSRLMQRFRSGPPLSREERQSQDKLLSSSSTTLSTNEPITAHGPLPLQPITAHGPLPVQPITAHGPLPLQAGGVVGGSSPSTVSVDSSSSNELAATVSTQSRMPRVSSIDEFSNDESISERAEQLLSYSNHFAGGTDPSAHPMTEGRGRASLPFSGLGEVATGGEEGGDILQQWRLARRLAEARNESVSMDWMLQSVSSDVPKAGPPPNIRHPSHGPLSSNTEVYRNTPPSNRHAPLGNKDQPPSNRDTPLSDPPPCHHSTPSKTPAPHVGMDQHCLPRCSHSHCQCQYGISCFDMKCPSIRPCSCVVAHTSVTCPHSIVRGCHCRTAVGREEVREAGPAQRHSEEGLLPTSPKGGPTVSHPLHSGPPGTQLSALKPPCVEGSVVLGGRGAVEGCVPCPVRYHPNTSVSFLDSSLGSSDWGASFTVEGHTRGGGRREKTRHGGGHRAIRRSRSAPERERTRQPLKDASTQDSMKCSLDVSDQALKPCVSESDLSPPPPQCVHREPCGSGGVSPRGSRSSHSLGAPNPVHSVGVATTERLREPLSSTAAALSGHAPSWCDDMGDDILKMLIARARFYDRAIRIIDGILAEQ